MKTPIEPKDIRRGDRVLATYKVFDAEYEVTYTSSGSGPWKSKGEVDIGSVVQHYLLDRPKPPVDLPNEPTLGWAEFVHGDKCLSIWQMRPVCQCGGSAGGDPEKLESFTPATAVPTSALDEFREAVGHWEMLDANSIVGKFLAAIDGANS